MVNAGIGRETMMDTLQEASKEALRKIVCCPFRNSPYSVHGKQIIHIAECVSQGTLCMGDILKRLADIFSTTCQGISATQDFDCLITKFHQLRTDRELIDAVVGDIRETVDSELIEQFVQTYLLQVFECAMEKIKELKKVDKETVSGAISDSEKYTLCYIGGYLLRAAPLKCPKELKQSMIELCQSFESDGDSVHENAAWVVKVSRGGLKVPSSDFLDIIMTFEFCLKRHVNVDTLSRLSLKRDILTEHLMCDHLVKAHWEKTGYDCRLLEVIVRIFLTVRGFAITRVLKRQSEKRRTSQGGKSFRKVLKQVTNNTT